jgi:hypothetical protein
VRGADITFHDRHAKAGTAPVGSWQQLPMWPTRKFVRPGPDVVPDNRVRPERRGFLACHKNMTTIYSNSTAIPHGGGDPNTDLVANAPSFDVYEVYQRALADEEVSLMPF